MPYDTYYNLKPYLPFSVRMAVRRAFAKRLLAKSSDKWPILESAGSAPENWSGWPNGKQFAVVLTHDVESSEGVAASRQLAELEMAHGFVSSFNFIPEGEYEDPQDLREWLAERGFEVGVHDLYHDGKLYRNLQTFRKNAAVINRYLRKWKAVGFRSGFMHHNLEWMHELDIAYDSSTFDTDPFEPQPDGVETIFPFWVPAPQKSGLDPQLSSLSSSGSKGYVELPYTLPQDSTLFLLFGEKSIDIWKRKLDWIAERGGMALMNVHPDYTAFNGKLGRRRQFPVGFFTEFLKYVRTRYSGQYWNPLPKEIAQSRDWCPAKGGGHSSTKTRV